MGSTSSPLVFPLIDLGPYLKEAPTQEDIAGVVAEVRAACAQFGFFQVKNHGVPLESQYALLDALRNFFGLPAEEKAKLSFLQNPGRRGYESSGMTVRVGDKLPDAKEVSRCSGPNISNLFSEQHPAKT